MQVLQGREGQCRPRLRGQLTNRISLTTTSTVHAGPMHTGQIQDGDVNVPEVDELRQF